MLRSRQNRRQAQKELCPLRGPVRPAETGPRAKWSGGGGVHLPAELGGGCGSPAQRFEQGEPGYLLSLQLTDSFLPHNQAPGYWGSAARHSDLHDRLRHEVECGGEHGASATGGRHPGKEPRAGGLHASSWVLFSTAWTLSWNTVRCRAC